MRELPISILNEKVIGIQWFPSNFAPPILCGRQENACFQNTNENENPLSC